VVTYRKTGRKGMAPWLVYFTILDLVIYIRLSRYIQSLVIVSETSTEKLPDRTMHDFNTYPRIDEVQG
jgi:hypothetical protein